MSKGISKHDRKFMFELSPEDERLAFAVRRHCFNNKVMLREFFRQAMIEHLISEGEIQVENDLDYIKLPGEK